jgi:hypothetical protein
LTPSSGRRADYPSHNNAFTQGRARSESSGKCSSILLSRQHTTPPKLTESVSGLQNLREEIFKDMLSNFNEGRSKSYYCIAATVIKIEELKQALSRAKEDSYGLDLKSKAKTLHSILDEIAKQEGYYLGLRKKR